METQERPRLQISLFITFRNASGQIVSFRSDSTSTWNNLKSVRVSQEGIAPALHTYNEDFLPPFSLSLSFFSVLSVRCIQIGRRPFQVWLPAKIKPLINEMDRTAALRIFLHAAISNIQYGEEEWERNHLLEINVI